MNKNYYTILGISKEATYQQIKTAYYDMAKEQHPDLNGDKTAMAEVNEAYSVLSDFDKKKAYDESLEPKKIFKGDTHGSFTPIYNGWSGNVDLLKNALITASGSIEDITPDMALNSGWKASGNNQEWLEIQFFEPSYLMKFSVDAFPIPYHVKRNNINFVEIHRLIGVINDKEKIINEFRLATAGDRDLKMELKEPVGPYSSVKLVSISSPLSPGWKNLRIYGDYLGNNIV